MALDEANHLCSSLSQCVISVLDTQTGKEVTSSHHQGVDDITYDPASKRVYAACDGAIDIYEQSGRDCYKLLGRSLQAHGEDRAPSAGIEALLCCRSAARRYKR